jgi:hypothetical protein
MLPLLPTWRKLHRWTSGSVGRDHPPAVCAVLPLLRRSVVGHVVNVPCESIVAATGDVVPDGSSVLEGVRSDISLHRE